MPTIDQQLRAIARSRPGVPYWILEKDYVLGYLLYGMAQVGALRETLVLKGRTALRKFYFAEYRFSEDLDFSAVVPPSDFDTALHEAVLATEAQLQEEGPFAVTLERLTLRDPHPTGQDAFTVMVRSCLRLAEKQDDPTLQALAGFLTPPDARAGTGQWRWRRGAPRRGRRRR